MVTNWFLKALTAKSDLFLMTYFSNIINIQTNNMPQISMNFTKELKCRMLKKSQ